jgi:hypothetical protein
MDCSSTTIGTTGVLERQSDDDEDEPDGEVLTIGMALGCDDLMQPQSVFLPCGLLTSNC